MASYLEDKDNLDLVMWEMKTEMPKLTLVFLACMVVLFMGMGNTGEPLV